MSSSKVMTSSSSSRNSDLKRKLSSDFLRLDTTTTSNNGIDCNSSNFETETNINNNSPLNTEIKLIDAVGGIETPITETVTTIITPCSTSSGSKKRTVDDVWRDIVAGKNKSNTKPKQEMMTLEDFLVKAGAVDDDENEEDMDLDEEKGGIVVEVKKETVLSGIQSYRSYDSNPIPTGGVIGGMDVGIGRVGNSRSMSLLEPLDKAAQQRQRRMIKNRESAARSRERKQAYQVELETMAMRLEEENERLLQEKAEWTKKRLKQLMENVIPVVEMRKPPRLRRVRSMQW